MLSLISIKVFPTAEGDKDFFKASIKALSLSQGILN